MPTPNNLAALRRAHGVSQSALARELNIDKTTVWRWEQGKRQIADDMKLRLAERFDVTPAQLMGWDPLPLSEAA